MGIRRDQAALANQVRERGATWTEVADALRDRWPELNPRAAMRLARGWSQQDAALAWNDEWPSDAKSAKNWSYWERWPLGGRPPRLEDIARLAELYQCPAAYLLTDLGDYQDLDDQANTQPESDTPPVDPRPHMSQEIAGIDGDPWEVDETVRLKSPAGRFFAGVPVEAAEYPAVDDGRVLVKVPERAAKAARGRGLVIGVIGRDDGRRLFGMDVRRARRRLSKSCRGAPLVVPDAYLLDELTLGLVWAIANLDQPLLDDDAALSACQPHLADYDATPRSSVGADAASGLSVVSQMWLGSEFCARHILRNASGLSHHGPAFWTQEQHGEEASTWLFFTHKLDYLQTLSERFKGADLSRSFCVPHDAVAGSQPSERVLFLLAAALMESCGIEVIVCVEPEYTAVEGFVLDEDRRAIVASWVGTEALWQVDVTDARPTIRELADANGYAHAHSVVAGPDPRARLEALASYLELDWPGLLSRCAALGDYGTAGLYEPRSRLLSSAGADRACRFLGELREPHEGPRADAAVA